MSKPSAPSAVATKANVLKPGSVEARRERGVAVPGVPSLGGHDEVISRLRSCRGLDSGLVCAIRAPDQDGRACAV
jgi:hypothetical protein